MLESGEPREVHHFCLLLGYGVQAINPYMAYESLNDMIGEGMLKDITYEKAVYGYIKGAVKGVVKVMSKMGISTIQSYCGAQIFEAVGLSQELVDGYFTWTASRVGGIGLEQIAEEAQRQHARAFSGHPGERPHPGGARPVPVPQGRRAAPVQSAVHSPAAESLPQPTITRCSSPIRR